MKLNKFIVEQLSTPELQNVTGGKKEISQEGSNSSRHSCYTNMPDADSARIDAD